MGCIIYDRRDVGQEECMSMTGGMQDRRNIRIVKGREDAGCRVGWSDFFFDRAEDST